MLGQAHAGLARPEEAILAWPAAGRSYRAALEAFNQALAIDEELASVYLYRGLTHLALGDGQEAVNDLLEARRTIPGEYIVNFALGRALLDAGRAAEAKAYFNTGLDLAGTDTQQAAVYYWRALALESLGENPAAARDWLALLLLPGDALQEGWGAAAREHLDSLATPTSTATATPTATATVTATKTSPATKTATTRPTTKPTASPTPRTRLTPSPTPRPAGTGVTTPSPNP
jgi:tetratricopeptide (TPR) repeat protein